MADAPESVVPVLVGEDENQIGSVHALDYTTILRDARSLEQDRLRCLVERLGRDWNAEPEEVSGSDQTFDADGR